MGDFLFTKFTNYWRVCAMRKKFMKKHENTLSLRRNVGSAEKGLAVSYVQRISKLTLEQSKEVITKGGFWVRKQNRGQLAREHNPEQVLQPGDSIELYYDPAVLSCMTIPATLIQKQANWSIWFKPAGMLSEGTQYGDHCSLIRQAELECKTAFLIHRLDREVAGLMVIAHNSSSADRWSRQWETSSVQKWYRALVVGAMPQQVGVSYDIRQPLNGQACHTKYIIRRKLERTTLLDLQLITGRYHQIRRHLDGIGYPILGDPRYGQRNKNQEGIMLVCWKLEFRDPDTGKPGECILPNDRLPALLQESKPPVTANLL